MAECNSTQEILIALNIHPGQSCPSCGKAFLYHDSNAAKSARIVAQQQRSSVLPTELRRVEELLSAVLRLQSPDLYECASGKTREDLFLETIAPSWPLPFQNFCCLLRSLYGDSHCRTFPMSCSVWSVGAHIIPHSADVRRITHLVRLTPSEIDTPKNGLPLCKPFEIAFDLRGWCFLFNSETKRFEVQLLDAELTGVVQLVHHRTMQTTRFQPQSEDGKPLEWEQLKGLSVHIPQEVSRSALMYHAWCSCTYHKRTDLLHRIAPEPVRSGSPPDAIWAWLREQEQPGNDRVS